MKLLTVKFLILKKNHNFQRCIRKTGNLITVIVSVKGLWIKTKFLLQQCYIYCEHLCYLIQSNGHSVQAPCFLNILPKSTHIIMERNSANTRMLINSRINKLWYQWASHTRAVTSEIDLN